MKINLLFIKLKMLKQMNFVQLLNINLEFQI